MKFRNVARRYYSPASGDEGGGNAGGGAGGNTDQGGADDEQQKQDGDEQKQDGGEQKQPESKLSDTEAKLLREMMQHKQGKREAEAQVKALAEKLKQFEGIDLDQVKSMLQKQAEEQERRLAEEGNWNALKQQMAEQHAAQLAAVQAQLEQERSGKTALQQQIEEMSIGSAFTGSEFISKQLVLTPAKARVIYGQHFDVVDGQVVAYDKPRGAEARTQLVDAAGEPLPFDVALAKLVERDPERDHLLRSQAKPGAKSGSDKLPAGAKVEADSGATGVGRIERGIGALLAQSAKRK